MNYIGEHLWIGKLGHFLVLTALVASILATIFFYYTNFTHEAEIKNKWRSLARISFAIQSVCFVAIFLLLLFTVSKHYHEYFFAWNHSSRTLQPQYLLSCIWEDQNGSFLLWTIWNSVLGYFFIKKQTKYEAPVLLTISLSQVIIATMMLGIYVADIKIGTSPFALLREELNAPFLFKNPNYLSLPQVYNGNDLNALLQNYWMVIHPPVLFLGFASTIIPFGFAVHGILNKDNEWVKDSLPWAIFSAAILGLGIMMGAAWAYESLSFGGYWAWDPVENASLVPWITLIAGLHTAIVYNKTSYNLRTTYFLYIISFLLVLYSTFLTRSGILGDTSVHAFTETNTTTQLFLFLSVFIWLVPILSATAKTKFVYPALFIVFLIAAVYSHFMAYTMCAVGLYFLVQQVNRTNPTKIKQEQELNSREFWLFVGSIILVLSAFIITVKTSLPVINNAMKSLLDIGFLNSIIQKWDAGYDVFSKGFAMPNEPEFSHNQVQIFVAIIIGILMAATQFLKYKSNENSKLLRNVILPTIIALFASLAISVWGNIDYYKFGNLFLIAIHIAVFSSLYAVVANAYYLIKILKCKVKFSGASITHIGFGLILLGILISSSKKAVLSWNSTGISVFKKSKMEDPAENIALFKDKKTDLKRSNYYVTYLGNSYNVYSKKKVFNLKFEDKKTGTTFSLHPTALKANKGMEGYSFNPDKKHFLSKDIFVYVSSFLENEQIDTTQFIDRKIKLGETLGYWSGRIMLSSIITNIDSIKKIEPQATQGIIFNFDILTRTGYFYRAQPKVIVANNITKLINDSIATESLIIKPNKLNENNTTNVFDFGIKKDNLLTNIVTLKVYEFPMIGILWIGVIVMTIGFAISIFYRIKK